MMDQLRFFGKTLAPAREVDWEAAYQSELPRIYNFFRYRVGDDQLAEDLTAATFEKAWRNRQRYRHDLSAFSTWLFTIARHVAIDHFRQPKPEVPLENSADFAAAEKVEDVAQQRADFERLSRLLVELPDRERELVALKYGAGLNNRQIAKISGLSESNVGTILQRVMQHLRTAWE